MCVCHIVSELWDLCDTEVQKKKLFMKWDTVLGVPKIEVLTILSSLKGHEREGRGIDVNLE